MSKCKVEGCQKQTQKDGYCIRHARQAGHISKKCKMTACHRMALLTTKTGFCLVHYLPRYKCAVTDCSKTKISKSQFCAAHRSGREPQMCSSLPALAQEDSWEPQDWREMYLAKEKETQEANRRLEEYKQEYDVLKTQYSNLLKEYRELKRSTSQ